MSIFSKILDKLGLHKDQPEVIGTTDVVHPQPPSPANEQRAVLAVKPREPAPTSEKGVRTTTGTADRRQKDDVAVKESPAPTPTKPTTPKPISQVDVMSMLEQKAKGTGLNWKQSISDLLFLLGIDNSRAARMELAKELGAPADVMSDSARMNTWLHKTVLRKIAENGGNIPQELLD